MPLNCVGLGLCYACMPCHIAIHLERLCELDVECMAVKGPGTDIECCEYLVLTLNISWITAQMSN